MSLSGIKTTPTIDEVIQWFRPLDGEVKRLLAIEANLNKKIVTKHIESLIQYYNIQVATSSSKWTRLYADCLTDIGHNPNDLKKLEIMSKIFISKSGENETQLNKMTREAFVRLFAKTMDKIIKDEEKELELRKKQQMEEEKQRRLDDEEINAEELEEQRLLDVEARNAEELAGFNAGYTTRGTSDTSDTRGGKSKKSKKKSRKRNASKRRNRRTRNYKKK